MKVKKYIGYDAKKQRSRFRKVEENDDEEIQIQKEILKKDNAKFYINNIIIMEKQKENIESLNIEQAIQKFLRTDTGNVILFIGASFCGKTHNMMKISEYFRKHLNGVPIFMCGNPENKLHNDEYPIFEGIYGGVLKVANEINKYYKKDPFNILFVVDDILNIKQSNVISNMAIIHRNNFINSMISTQQSTILGVNARSNARLFFFGSQQNRNRIEKVLNEFLNNTAYFSNIKNKEDKIDEYMRLTSGQKFIIYAPLHDTNIFYLLSN